ncbi:hypothetical protein [Streptosporangium subroseum]|uniref:hypothetical protein n=1 Tax=Streptosporangium subroseum TaxID=106412 RepID=UPI003084E664|nr:hypothetical protein OHB15_02370 [Streptosporangium subroseum]
MTEPSGAIPSPWLAGVNDPTPAPSTASWTDTRVPGSGTHMNGVVATSPRDAWAVGGGEDGDLIMRWDGRAWRSVTGPGGLRPVRAVSASSSDNVWVFGNTGAWRWNGRGWSSKGGLRDLHLPWLKAAVVAGPRDVWVAGDSGDSEDADATDPDSRRPFLGRWSGAGWSEFPLPSGLGVHAFSALGPHDVWALARRGDDSDSIMRWDGDRWNTVPMPPLLLGKKVQLTDITAVSADEAWAIGDVSRSGTRTAVMIRWDGRRWSVVDGPARFVYFSAVASDGDGGVWVGAHYWDYSDGRVLLRYDGRSWSYEMPPRAQNAPVVSDFALVPGDDQVIAVGGNPSFDEDSRAWIWMRR